MFFVNSLSFFFSSPSLLSISLHLPSSCIQFSYHVLQPHSQIMIFQRVNETVGELRKWFKSPATQILVNVESKSKYPFIIFGPLGPSFNASGFVPSASTEPLSSELRINDGIYNVCGSVSRPAPCSGSSHHHLQLDPDATPLGYVVTAFQTFPGEDSERLERNWITWTGILFFSLNSFFLFLSFSVSLKLLFQILLSWEGNLTHCYHSRVSGSCNGDHPKCNLSKK